MDGRVTPLGCRGVNSSPHSPIDLSSNTSAQVNNSYGRAHATTVGTATTLETRPHFGMPAGHDRDRHRQSCGIPASFGEAGHQRCEAPQQLAEGVAQADSPAQGQGRARQRSGAGREARPLRPTCGEQAPSPARCRDSAGQARIGCAALKLVLRQLGQRINQCVYRRILPARAAGGRARQAAVGHHRLCPWPPACEPTQGGLRDGPSVVRPRVTSPAPAQARATTGVAVHFHVGTGCAVHAGGGRDEHERRYQAHMLISISSLLHLAREQPARDPIETQAAQEADSHSSIMA